MSDALIIRDGVIVADEWTLIRAADDVYVSAPPVGNLILPLSVWNAQRSAINPNIGVWIDGADDPAQLADSIDQLALIAVDFPKFTDGRGYSTGALLRSRYGFKGELRAIGDVLRDQLFYLRRAGFNAFKVRSDKDIHDALQALNDFSETYQGAVEQPLPLFKRRAVLASNQSNDRSYLKTTGANHG